MRTNLPLTTILGLTLVLSGCGNISGSETIVKGNDNLLVQDQTIDRVAAALAEFKSTPEVTDADIAAVYEEVRRDALEGDLDAALVMLKVAAIQRAPAN